MSASSEFSGFREPSAYVPHRPPILCIDAVTNVEADCVHADSHPAARSEPKATAKAQPSDEGTSWEPWLVEGLAQTAAVHHGYHRGVGEREDNKGMLVGIRGLRIHRAPGTGETLRYEATVLSELGPVTLFAGTAFVGTELVAEGELKFFVEG